MTKVRVHELAKELNKSNKEILDFLQEKKVEVKSHMSSLTDEQENMVKDAFGGKKEASSEETPKKKNIVQVFRSGWKVRRMEKHGMRMKLLHWN